MDEKQSEDNEDSVSAAKTSPSDTFCNIMTNMICQKDVEFIHSMQLEALSTFEKTNEKFDRFNRLSIERYNRLYAHFQNHTKMLIDMKKDLDIVFRRIRNLKTKLSKQYGDAFLATSKNIHRLEESLEAEPEATYVEEKPKTEQLTSKTTTTAQNVTQIQDSSNSQNKNIAEIVSNLSEGENSPVESDDANAFKNKLIPQLSSSDESYGVQDTDTDEDDYGKDDDDDDYGKDDMDDGSGENDDGDEDYGGDIDGDVNVKDDGDDNDNIDNDNEKDNKSMLKESQSNTLASTSNVDSDKLNENLKQNDNVGIHQQVSSSDESLESDSDDEKDATTQQHPDSEQNQSTSKEINQ